MRGSGASSWPSRAGKIDLLSPQGTNSSIKTIVEELAAEPRLLLLCGRYEGFDQRVIDILQPDEISIGDYIFNGGEAAAMVVIDACIRLIPGVLGDEQSSQHDSFSSGNRLLEFPQYSRPREFRGHDGARKSCSAATTKKLPAGGRNKVTCRPESGGRTCSIEYNPINRTAQHRSSASS